jgi:hypothetical protein
MLSDERMGLSFTIAADPRQRSHSGVPVPRNAWPYLTVSDSRLHKPGGPGRRIYIPQEQDDPVIPPDIVLLFRRLLRLAGLRWRYSNLTPHGLSLVIAVAPRYTASAQTAQKTPPPTVPPLLRALLLWPLPSNGCCTAAYIAAVA